MRNAQPLDRSTGKLAFSWVTKFLDSARDGNWEPTHTHNDQGVWLPVLRLSGSAAAESQRTGIQYKQYKSFSDPIHTRVDIPTAAGY